ncbi:PilW family protein [Aliidiomarina haloalkalitolerans]|uniref:Uncharacterized protein n=1 Tax=Aliidiomarina haloalkalitolerans TaxID=859059 RepID=A0A432VSN1_9GAMM|nr:type II secretion system protein [Aliidiomarina haloalkalitolerans]RUO19428.1 hypothetical protein CWE06_07795 [Aliidiomarina haloalkalitolerans]
MKASQRGYTLVELITVIILLGVIGTFTFNYIGFGTRIYSDTVGRERITGEGRFAVNRLTIELKNALPRSIQVFDDGRCIEFLPVIASGQYVDIALPSQPTNQFIVVPPLSSTALSPGQHLFVFAENPAQVYAGTSPRRKTIGTPATTSAGLPAGLFAINFVESEVFETQSTGRRFYVTENPVQWCFDASTGELVRRAGHALTSAGSVAIAAPSQERMATGLANEAGEPVFSVAAPTLNRNSLVIIDFRFTRPGTGEFMQLAHEVFLPNVP